MAFAGENYEFTAAVAFSAAYADNNLYFSGDFLCLSIVGFVSGNQAADEALATVSEMLLSGLLLLAVDLALFGWAIFSPCFRADNGRLPTMNERAEKKY